MRLTGKTRRTLVCRWLGRYNLYGVLVHAGRSTHSGHYYCFVRSPAGMWYELDDSSVHQVG